MRRVRRHVAGRPGAAPWRGWAAVAVVAVGASTIVSTTTVEASTVVSPPAAAQAEPETFPLVGQITVRDPDGTAATPSLFFVDSERRQMVATAGGSRAYLVDLDTLQQTGSVALPFDSQRPPLVFDQGRQRLLFGIPRILGTTAVGCPSTGPIVVACPGRPTQIHATSLTGAASETFTFPAQFSGRSVPALSYDPGRDLLFALTELQYATSAQPGSEVWVHAIDASRLGETGPDGLSLPPLWSYQIEGCGILPGSNTRPPFLGFATTGEFLYTMCMDILGVTASGSRPSIHGAVVVDFGGADPSAQGAAVNFTREFYPFAGDFSKGFTFGDQAGDRVMAVVADGAGQQMYAFDAAHRAYTGSVPLGSSNVFGGTFDPATGRAYTLDQDHVFGVVATDVAPVPALQGSRNLPGVGLGVFHNPGFDPVTRRLFISASTWNLRGWGAEEENLGTEPGSIRVYEDRSAPFADLPLVDPDAATADIDEEMAVQVTHTGGGSAFGARALLVGGARSTAAGGTLDNKEIWNNARDPGSGLSDFRPEGGQRGLFLGRVVEAQLTGSTGSGEAKARSVGASLDEATESDLDGKLGAPFGRTGQPPPEAARWEALKAKIGEFGESRCSDFGDEDDPRDASQSGSRASCRQRDEVAASASSAEDMAISPVQIGFASSEVTLRLDETEGMVSRSTAVARGVHVEVAGAGSISIGEVRSVAETRAKGRPGTAGSDFETTISNVRIVDASGEGFSCTQCDPSAVAAAINARFPMRVQAMSPRPAADEATTGSPGGAQAVVIKDTYAYWNDANVNGDSAKEVTGLQLVLYNDARAASRLVVQLGAVFAESKYLIGAPAPEVEPLDPASLAIELLDQAGDALSGGMFEVRKVADAGLPAAEPTGDEPASSDQEAEDAPEDEGGKAAADGSGTSAAAVAVAETDDETTDEPADVADDLLEDPLGTGELIGACVTDDDGTGDCTFDDLEPGAYLVTQTAAPAGYAEAPPFPVMLTPGFASTVSFTNIKAVGTIEISLSDTADPPKPLPGGEFAVLADDGDGLLGAADVELGRCTTGADGTCDAIEAPVGTYVVHQVSAPNGLEPAADVAFAFTEPGQTAALAFLNGLPLAPPAAPAPFTPGPPAPVSSGSVAMTPPSPAPPPVVTSEPIDASAGRSPLARMASLPAQAVGFLTRSPGEAAMFAGVWSLLLAPAYLAARRRKLTLVKEGI